MSFDNYTSSISTKRPDNLLSISSQKELHESVPSHRERHIRQGYLEYDPPAELSQYVSHYWFLEFENHSNGNQYHQLLPRSNYEIIINYRSPFVDVTNPNDPKPVGSFINGINNDIRTYKANGPIGIFAICLKPYAWHLLTGFPAMEFSERLHFMEDLPIAFKRLARQIIQSASHQEKICIANKIIWEMILRLGQNNPKLPIDRITEDIKESRGTEGIDPLAKRYHSSPSKFERVFKEIIGITPKKYARLIRFKNVVLQCMIGTPIQDVVYGLDFFDQAHLINEFRRYANESPVRFMKRRRPQLELYYSNIQALGSYQAY